MDAAFAEAEAAGLRGEVPIGAVVVLDGTILARAGNRTRELNDPTAHAEMLAIREACHIQRSERLPSADLYVTLEPCPMCAGAIVHCRPERVVFGCGDPKAGAAGGWINLLDANPPLNHRCEVTAGVMGMECLALIQGFFREAREKKKAGREKEIPDA